MSDDIPRLRMFAGPNGSGKSTIKSMIRPELLGVYINPDEIEKKIKEGGFLDFKNFSLEVIRGDVLDFFENSALLKKAGLIEQINSVSCVDGRLKFSHIKINSYFASVIADFIRHRLLELKISFTFETVMSSADKVEFLRHAISKGYRNYLYFVATDDPAINISRVQQRVRAGGHAVPEEKIVSRYERSLALLIDAVKLSSRAYIFDNSGDFHVWLAEITDGNSLELKTSLVPAWLQESLLDKFV